jgi:hypothetical protein
MEVAIRGRNHGLFQRKGYALPPRPIIYLKLEKRFSEVVNRFIALVLGDLHSAIDKEL